MKTYQELVKICEEDVFSTVHSFWSLTTSYEATLKSSEKLSNQMKLAVAHSLTGFQHLVILGICRLDDDNTLFRHAAKSIQKTDGTRYTELTTLMKDYRKTINQVKDQHRKIYIGHAKKELDYTAIPEIPPLHDLVLEAVRVLEVFSEEPVDLVVRTADEWSLDLLTWLRGYDNPHAL